MPVLSNLVPWLQRRGVVRRVKPFGLDWTEDLKAIGGRPRTIFDVGANLGQTVEICARAFPEAEIHAFEPAPETFVVLQRNVAPIANVRITQAGLSDQVGETQMTAGLGGENSIGGSHRGDAATTAIALDTVDNYMKANGVARVDLLKMDVEGHELQVLAGAQEALAGGAIDYVLSETDFRGEGAHTDLTDLRDALEPHGFRVASFYGEGIDARGWIWGDVLFVREGLTKDPVYDAGARRFPLGYRKPLLAQRPGQSA